MKNDKIKLTEEEKKERKRKYDKLYRQNDKGNLRYQQKIRGNRPNEFF